MTNKSSFFAILICFLGTFNCIFWIGWLASELSTKNGFSKSYFGYAYAMHSLTYLSSCFLYGHFGEGLPKKLVMTAGILLSGISFILLGPFVWLDVPNILGLKLFGLVLQGLCQVAFFLPIIPEMIENLMVDFNIEEGNQKKLDIKLNDKVNDLYALIFAITNFVAPNIGSFMYTTLGGGFTFSIMALVSIFIGSVSFLFNCGPTPFKDNQKLKVQLSALRKNRSESETDLDKMGMASVELPLVQKESFYSQSRSSSIVTAASFTSDDKMLKEDSDDQKKDKLN